MVSVIIHRNRHGEEVSVYTDHDAALHGACNGIMLANLDEIEDGDKRDEIRALIEAKKYDLALPAWHEAQYGSLDVDTIDIYDSLTIGTTPMPATAIRCPHCGNEDLDELAVTETYTAYHYIRGVNVDGKAMIENALAASSPSERFDDGASDYKLSCNSCGKSTDDLAAAGLGDPAEWDWV